MAAVARTARAGTRARLVGGALAVVGCLVCLALVPAARAVTITDFPADGGQVPRYIHLGPDRNLWFTAGGPSPGIGRIRSSGQLLSSIPSAIDPVDLLTLPDGTVVWTGNAGLGRRLFDGSVQTLPYPLTYAIALTASGDLRWTESAGAGFLTFFVAGWGSPAHACCTSVAPTRLTGLTLGGDGKLWMAAYEANQVVRLNPGATATEQAFDLPPGSGPARLALGPDGNLWVTMYDASAIDRIAPNGAATRFALAPGRGPNDIVLGPDGALWFTELKADRIGRMTVGGELQEFPIAAGSQPIGITGGPDGALWFTETGLGRIGRLQLDSPGGGGGGVTDREAPRFLTGAAFTPTRFRVARGPTPTGARPGAPARGSWLSYALSEPAAVTIVIARTASGRRVGRACRAATRANRTRPRCTRLVSVGTLRRDALQGLNRLAFTGRIGRRALAPGGYRATATATDAAGNISGPSTATFTILG